jgi:hypothetical protein
MAFLRILLRKILHKLQIILDVFTRVYFARKKSFIGMGLGENDQNYKTFWTIIYAYGTIS